MAKDTKSLDFWQTLPGVLTTVLGVMTAITGLFIFLKQTDTSDRHVGPQPEAQQETRKPSEDVGSQPATIPDKTLPRKLLDEARLS